MASVQLRSMDELARALKELGERVEKEAIRAMQDVARFGIAVVLRESARAEPRPKASGHYENAWLIHRLRDGATVSNSARHSVFVERGRRPGRAPPLDPIKEWIELKRLDTRALTIAKKRRKGAGRVTRKKTAERFRRTFTHRLARLIARKIAARGTKGRFILRKSMPLMAKRASRELKRAVARICSDPPRGNV